MKKKMLGCLLAAVILPVTLLGGCAGPLVESDEDLEVVRIVNQQLQDVFAPQLKGQSVLDFWGSGKRGGTYRGGINYTDKRQFFNEEERVLHWPVSGWCNMTISDALTVENYSLTSSGRTDLSTYYDTRFYQDYLIPRGQFYLNDVDGDPLDLSQVVVDESRLEDDVYREEALARLNAFFGLDFASGMRQWIPQMRGSYAVVFSLGPNEKRPESLALLAELDQTEGLSVTGIYYDGLDEAAICKPFRADDPINPDTLDPRESLRVLAAGQEIAHMLMASELYGIKEIDFRKSLEGLGDEDRRISCSPIGACVVTDGSGFLTPEMFEAISKVCYRCLDVKLITDY